MHCSPSCAKGDHGQRHRKHVGSRSEPSDETPKWRRRETLKWPRSGWLFHRHGRPRPSSRALGSISSIGLHRSVRIISRRIRTPSWTPPRVMRDRVDWSRCLRASPPRWRHRIRTRLFAAVHRKRLGRGGDRWAGRPRENSKGRDNSKGAKPGRNERRREGSEREGQGMAG
jgi:hypothetical protein